MPELTLEEKCSMDYWYPLIQDVSLKQPKTIKVPCDLGIESLFGGVERIDKKLSNFLDKIDDAATKLGYPIFLRSDHFSAKHGWDKTCFIQNKTQLKNNFSLFLDYNFSATVIGLPINSFYVREYIPMDSMFTAFSGNLPINPEIRIFAKDSEYLCHHWYWVEDSIRRPSTDEWEPLILEGRNKAKRLLPKDKAMEIAEEIGSNLGGYWSIDICLSAKDEWYLIDLAPGELSWHPTNCSVYEKYK